MLRRHDRVSPRGIDVGAALASSDGPLQRTASTPSSRAKVVLAMVAYTLWQHLLQVHRSFVLLRKRFPHQTSFRAMRSSWVYATIVLLGDAGNLIVGLTAPKLALRTLACALRMSTTNFRYGPHARNVLDLYGTSMSPSDHLKPVVIFIHGGAWALSSKFHYGAVGETLERHGIVTVVPSYRTFPHGDVGEMMHDLEAIVKWTVENIATHGGDPKRITLSGHSSGAHLCALLLVQSAIRCSRAAPTLANDIDVVHHIQAFVGLSGPYDITDHYAFEQNREIVPFVRAHSISPLYPSFHGPRHFSTFSPTALVVKDAHLDARLLPPFHLFHGVDDFVVPLTASEKFAAHLNQIGAKAVVTPFPRGHVEILLALMDGFPELGAMMLQSFLGVVLMPTMPHGQPNTATARQVGRNVSKL
ncbi:hypothetical protein H310_04248 [Aphanomyces invadans]|uniref:BD-FAE-like domain-containing protein n=1 Tax=Aphanomyces invadans TaxID=157072 RepID=A0A024UGG0_9STRA|nr:hypothetical protein H310_04248 [Aphanomyces invadans]ETW05295.1 hypothetical protein H310_04248 [Aphanomyces invadans]|eukprot:XP_008866733.1 hypothetical protein H310_04248 [Aphanomyces invadans]